MTNKHQLRQTMDGISREEMLIKEAKRFAQIRKARGAHEGRQRAHRDADQQAILDYLKRVPVRNW